MLNRVVWSIVPCEGALCSWMHGTDFYLLCLPCCCTMGGGGNAIVFYNGCNNPFLSNASFEELVAYGFHPWGH